MSAEAMTALRARAELTPGQHRADVLACCWLTDDLALLLLSVNGTERPFSDPARWRSGCPSFALEIGLEYSTWLACVPFPPGHERPSLSDLELSPELLEAATVDPGMLHRRLLVGLKPETKESIQSFLVEATRDLALNRAQLAESLHDLRQGLRRSLPASIVEVTEPRALAVEAVVHVDDRAFYVEGWARHEGARLERLVAVSPEGERVEITAPYRCARRDVDEFYGTDDPASRLGLVAFYETRAPSVRAEGWLFELHDSFGRAVETAAPAAQLDARVARVTLLADLELEPAAADELKASHIRPALDRLQSRLAGQVSIESVDVLGARPARPVATIVVPLYRRLDFLEHQLAAFVADPELREAELVYVLDSPELADDARVFATELFRLYGLPFRLAVLDRNAGYATANNLGASLGESRRLVLLNSDVIPEAPGWLGELLRFFDGTPGAGAVSPKLVYEDGTIQFAGLYFDRPPGAPVWSNEHFFKGLSRHLPAANVARQVPAVTGACMVVDAAVFEELGGLNGGYVRGDYEDTDLCLRLARLGLASWYTPSATLFHLEGQSYPSEERRLASQYNKWLHTHLWGEEIERISAAADVRPSEAVTVAAGPARPRGV